MRAIWARALKVTFICYVAYSSSCCFLLSDFLVSHEAQNFSKFPNRKPGPRGYTRALARAREKVINKKQ